MCKKTESRANKYLRESTIDASSYKEISSGDSNMCNYIPMHVTFLIPDQNKKIFQY